MPRPAPSLSPARYCVCKGSYQLVCKTGVVACYLHKLACKTVLCFRDSKPPRGRASLRASGPPIFYTLHITYSHPVTITSLPLGSRRFITSSTLLRLLTAAPLNCTVLLEYCSYQHQRSSTSWACAYWWCALQCSCQVSIVKTGCSMAKRDHDRDHYVQACKVRVTCVTHKHHSLAA